MFIIGLTFLLFSCEKNYSCMCKYDFTDEFGNPYGNGQTDFLKLKDITSTKNKAKKECDEADFTGYDETSGEFVIRDCSIEK